jgi:hypothetical protein
VGPGLNDPGAELVVGDPCVFEGVGLVAGKERDEVVDELAEDGDSPSEPNSRTAAFSMSASSRSSARTPPEKLPASGAKRCAASARISVSSAGQIFVRGSFRMSSQSAKSPR